MKKNRLLLLPMALVLLWATGCKKEYLDTNSPTAVTDDVVFSSYENTLHVLNGVLRNYYVYAYER